VQGFWDKGFVLVSVVLDTKPVSSIQGIRRVISLPDR
jgi:hypothetical protein